MLTPIRLLCRSFLFCRVTETNVAKPRKNVKELEARLNTLEQQLRRTSILTFFTLAPQRLSGL
jgi:hypothetical protein